MGKSSPEVVQPSTPCPYYARGSFERNIARDGVRYFFSWGDKALALN
jgi:hypothetical protein